MSNTKNDLSKSNWEIPEEDHSKTSIKKPKKSAGGVPSLASTIKHLKKQVGFQKSLKVISKMNQKDGFDCPGCAWPDPDGDRGIAPFCENGIKAVASEATKHKIDEAFFQQYSIDQLSNKSDFWLNQQGRITRPFWREKNATHYKPISWKEAFERISGQLKSLKSPNEAIFYASGRTSNEAAFLYQLFARLYGTNNLPDSSNMCHESSGVALKETIGIGKSTVTLKDFEKADCIFVFGQNPGSNHPRMLRTLKQAARRGCEIVTVNPLNEAGSQRFIDPKEVHQWLGNGTKLTSQYVKVKVNGDVPFLKGVMKELYQIEKENPGKVFNHKFIKDKTEGFEKFIEQLEKYSWEELTDLSGVSREQIQKIARLVVRSQRIICCWAMGLTQHKNAVANIQEIVNLLLLKGSIGKEGAGVCPVRGHSNVQGDRTMGISCIPDETFISNLEKEFHFKAPKKKGLDIVAAIQAMKSKKAKFYMALGGNVLSAASDTGYTAEAFSNCELTVQISTKLNRSHLVTGDEGCILPCLGRTEIDQTSQGKQFMSVENSMGIIHKTQGSLPPISNHLKSEIAIISELANHVFSQTEPKIDWSLFAKNYDAVRFYIERVVPGCKNYKEKVKKPGGFYLPNAVRDHCEFKTKTGKAHFTCHDLKATQELNKTQKFIMTSIRTHDQFNTTIYDLDDRYRGIYAGRQVVLMNSEDANELGLKEKQLVDLESKYKKITRSAQKFTVIYYDIPKGNVATYYPECNVLIPIEEVAEKSNTPTSKSILVSIKPHVAH